MLPLRKRAYTETFDAGGGFGTYTKDYIDVLLNSVEARKYIAVGEFDKAYGYAEKAYAASNRDPRILMNQGLALYTKIATLGLNDPNAKDSFRGDLTRRYAKIEPYALMAIIETRRGNEKDAASFRAQLQGLYDETDKSTVENATELATIRRWLGESYYQAEDYARAYHTFTRDDRSGLTKASDAIFSALLFVEKPLFEPLVFAMAGTTSDGMRFVTELPTRVMLYRSALKAGELEVARNGYDALLAEPQISGLADLHFRLLHERALIARREKNTGQALQYFEEAIDVLEGQRSSLRSDDYKLGFVGDKIDVYGDIIRLLVANNRPSEAFEYAERAKARALVDMLASRKDFAESSTNAETANLMRQLSDLENKSIQLASLDNTGAKTRGVQLKEVQKSLETTSPELASLVTVRRSEAAEIQSLLSADETLVEFYGQGSDLLAFVVNREGVKSFQINGDRLSDEVSALRSSIQNYRSGAHNRTTRRVYDRLLRPFEKILTGRMITFVAHGPLHYLPFAALNDGEKSLIERFEIRLLPSASVLKFLNKGTRSSEGLLAFGNPDRGDPKLNLPGAEAETRAIDRGWKQSRILLRNLASEANFRKFAPRFKYLHLASHGEFNPDDPLKSRMLLSAGDNEDGDLTVDELYSLKLNADLVTLSACETGIGDIKSGDDVIGLTRGFLYAGANSIVASLWPVSDEATALLMNTFYDELKKGKKSSALRKALLATKRKFRHPFFWSAFNLTGGA